MVQGNIEGQGWGEINKEWKMRKYAKGEKLVPLPIHNGRIRLHSLNTSSILL